MGKPQTRNVNIFVCPVCGEIRATLQIIDYYGYNICRECEKKWIHYYTSYYNGVQLKNRKDLFEEWIKFVHNNEQEIVIFH